MAATDKEIAVLGLGGMGAGMAKNLAHAGFRLRVWNRTAAKAKKVAALLGARLSESPRAAAQGADFVLTSLADDEAVRAVTFGGEGLLTGLGPTAIHLETSTISLALSRDLEDAYSKRGRGFVAAHVFGRPEAAERRQLWVAAGGPSDLIDECRPLFDAIGRGTFRFETAPQATLMKLLGNLMIASTIEALGETLALGEKGGIRREDAARVVEAIFGGSPVVKGYGERVARGSFEPAGFRMRLGFKDVSLALRAGEELRVPLPLASLLHDHLVEGIARGRGDLDWSALSFSAREAAGLSTSEEK